MFSFASIPNDVHAIKPQYFIHGLLSFNASLIFFLTSSKVKIFKLATSIRETKSSLFFLPNSIGFSVPLSKKYGSGKKLRSFFEKHKKFVSVAYYPDNDQILSKIALNFLRENKIQLSPLNINLIVSKCNGDRENLFNELKKIENYSLGGKKLNKENCMVA